MKNQRGYALAELLTAVAVVGLIMAAVFVIFQQGQDAYTYGAGRAEVQQTARGALDRLVRELRTGSVVSAATATGVTFQYIDDTGATVTVQYSLNGTNLERNQTSPPPGTAQPETVIGGVAALAFTYYDGNNTVTATPASVRTVNVRLTTQPQDTTASYSPGNRRAIVEDRARLRNVL